VIPPTRAKVQAASQLPFCFDITDNASWSGRKDFAAMKRLVCLAVVIGCYASSAQADVAAGRAALASGDYAAALQELRPLAAHGDAEAALTLGQMARNGWGVPRSDTAAWAFYKQAADQGQVEGLLRAGEFSDQGRGVPIDRRLAYRLYKRAAEAGNAQARGRIGEMALHGRGRKVNAAEAIAWLTQAAQADDAEAYALLDELAAKGRVTPPPAGLAAPAEAPARRVAEEIRRVVGDMGLALGTGSRLDVGGEVTALTRPDGSVLVTLPKVSVIGEAVVLREGTIRLVFRDITETSAKVELLPPAHVAVESDGVPMTTISLSGARLSGLWDFNLHALTDAQGEASAVALQLRDRIGLSLQGLTVARHMGEAAGGRISVAESLGVDNLSLKLSLGPQSLTLAAAGLALRSTAHDLDMAAFRHWAEQAGFDWRGGSVQAQLLSYGGIGRPAGAPLLAQADAALTIDGLSLSVGNLSGLALRRLDIGLGLSDLDQTLARAHLSYAHDGLGGEWFKGSLPRAQAILSIDNLPLAELLRAASTTAEGEVEAVSLGHGGDMPAAAPQAPVGLLEALDGAGTRIGIDDLTVGGEGWDARASGRATPAAAGMTLGLDAAVHGLDAFLATLSPATGEVLRGAARSGSDDKGNPVSLFQLALPPGGGALVNGKPLDVGR